MKNSDIISTLATLLANKTNMENETAPVQPETTEGVKDEEKTAE